ncbi:hypothetical protein [Bacillus sonorensis]|uniref:hypothetical protein n=1 Tax=Bacillus sonorensis TaxID=119858 RepID=UPI00098AE7ED|nr:hypothetical protein [Bacillus sonorensis]
MAKIKSPNPKFNGVSASLQFVNGEAETNDKWLIGWFKRKGYEVEEKKKETNKKAAKPAADKQKEKE